MCGEKEKSIWAGALLVLSIGVAPLIADDEQRLLERGAEVYATSCAGCHGVYGDGDGDERILESIKPRDFASGIFKYRSTPTGLLPTDGDLERTIAKGIRGTSMPHHAMMSEKDLRAVVAYTRTFFDGWETGAPAAEITLPPKPKYLGSPSSIRRGREVYELLQCGACHGPEGRGDGVRAGTLAPDLSGNPQVPFDFTGKKHFKGGGRPGDLYRTIATGLDGGAMSSFGWILLEPDGEVVQEGDGWHLVHYLLSLRQASAE